MRVATGTRGSRPEDYEYRRVVVDLSAGRWDQQWIRCGDLEDFLGGIGRGLKHFYRQDAADAYAPERELLVNTGLLSGSEVMTGLRTFIYGFSPLKRSRQGKPLPMWSAGSGDFGVRLQGAGIDDLLLRQRAAEPSILVIQSDGRNLSLRLEPAPDLCGLGVSAKMFRLVERFPGAHMAVIGPAGENFRNCWFAGVALSTGRMWEVRQPRLRWCGRGGFGGVWGSKNLLAIVVDAPTPPPRPPSRALAAINRLIATGPGSRKFRDPDRWDGAGGTWANYVPLQEVHAVPQDNFRPHDDAPARMRRDEVEKNYVVDDEGCYKCGIRCWKILYDPPDSLGRQSLGRYRCKVDYEPLNMLGNNCGVNEPDPVWKLIEECDELGFDAISLGATLSYVMDYNRRHPDRPLAGGLSFGDAEGMLQVMERIARGQEQEIGRGSLYLAQQTGELGYAYQCKGLELPAYLPSTNPGYPWAIAGGHMSMRTFLLLVTEGKTDLDYWVKAITERGLYTVRDDLVGLCKFAGLPDETVVEAIRECTGVSITMEELRQAVLRTFLRGYQAERRLGCEEQDYSLPAETFLPNPWVLLPHFLTEDFFGQLRRQVLERFDTWSSDL
jgi:aldehyde:ferredoxin oxidoreductase